jgi:hypothetical protein
MLLVHTYGIVQGMFGLALIFESVGRGGRVGERKGESSATCSSPSVGSCSKRGAM